MSVIPRKRTEQFWQVSLAGANFRITMVVEDLGISFQILLRPQHAAWKILNLTVAAFP
jgi:hypothetical protein